MQSATTRSLLVAGALTCAAVTTCIAQIAYSGYWVVGNLAANTCEIVTSNPVIDYSANSFGTGPYRSLEDARLARSTIGACPKEDPTSAVNRTSEDGASGNPG